MFAQNITLFRLLECLFVKLLYRTSVSFSVLCTLRAGCVLMDIGTNVVVFHFKVFFRVLCVVFFIGRPAIMIERTFFFRFTRQKAYASRKTMPNLTRLSSAAKIFTDA